tara:strand:+ start:1477 stop:3582 length:2106 start_codon:yes stop_codon:yes gene_type:complete
MATEVGSLTLKVETGDVKRAKTDVEKLGQSAAALEDEFQDVAGAAKTAGDATEGFGNKAKGAIPKNLPKAANDGSRSMDGFGRKAGMAGIQFEQLAGQIAAGQNPMRAVGVQASDLGFILGVPLLGAVVGIGAAIASVMLPALFNSKDASEELSDAIGDVRNAFERGSNGAIQFSSQLRDAAKSSRDLAKLELALAVMNAEAAFQGASENIGNALGEINRSLLGGADNYMAYAMAAEDTRDAQAGANAHFTAAAERVAILSEEFGITKQSAALLAHQFNQFRMDPTIEGLAGVARTLRETAESAENATPEFREFLTSMLQQIATAQDAGDALDAFNGALSESGVSFEEAKQFTDGFAQTLEEMIEAAERQRDVVGMSAAALAVQAASLRGADEDTQQLIQSIYEETAAREAQVRATSTAEAAEKRLAKEKKRAAELAEQQAEASAERTLQSVMTRNDTELEALERRLAEERSILDEAEFAGTISAQEYEDALAEIAEYGAARRSEIATKEAADRGQGSLELTDALMSMENALFKNKSEKQRAATQMAIGALDKEKRANAGKIMSDSYTAAMAAYKALAGIPLVGPLLGAAAAAAILGTGAKYAADSLKGRALGGQVRAGESYMVGERGPEVLTMGTGGGSITPNEAIRNENSQVVNKTANVSFNIQANDTQGFDELLVQRRGLIINVINEALNDQGKAAIA